MSAATLPEAHAPWTPRANPWVVAIVVTLAAFMEVLDTTIVNVALPHISGTMSATYDEATWTLTSYMVANSIVLPISAFFGRVLGRKRYFLICILMFTVCSLLCGLATQLWQLILFRLLQGFFGGGLQPNQQAILLDYFPPEQRSKAFGVSAIAIVVAPVFGPTLGGWITDTYSWRWVFLINVPVGILTMLAVYSLLEDPPWERARKVKRGGIDYIGIGLIALGIGCLQVVLDRGQTDDWLNSNFIVLFIIITVLSLTACVLWLLQTKNPVVDLRCLKDRNFTLSCLSIFGFATVLYGSSVLIPQLAQQQLGYTAMLAGLVLSPGAVGIILVIPIVGRFMPHVQTRYIVMLGFFLLGLALLYSSKLSPDMDFYTLAMIRSMQSVTIGLLFVPVTTLAYITLAPRLNGDGTALFTMFRNIAGSIGISLASTLLLRRSQVHQAYLTDHLTPFNEPYVQTMNSLTHAVTNYGNASGSASAAANGHFYTMLTSQAAFLAYQDIFGYCALMAFVLVAVAYLFSPVKAAGGGGAH